MVFTTLKLKRGSLSKLRELMQNPQLRLADGEPYFSKDLKSLFISDATGFYRIGNILVGTYDDRTLYEERGVLYFVTDTVRYKNTLWCYDGTHWVSVGSANEDVDFETIRLNAFQTIKRGDNVLAWFNSSQKNAVAVSSLTTIPNINAEDFFTVKNTTNFIKYSNVAVDEKFHLTAFVDNNRSNIYVIV